MINRLVNTADIAFALKALYFSRPDYGEALAAVALSFGIHPGAIGIIFEPTPIVNITPNAPAASTAQTMPPWSCFKQNG